MLHQFMITHPWLFLWLLCMAASGLAVVPLLIRRRTLGCQEGGFTSEPPEGVPAMLDLPGEYRIKPGDRPSRIPMRSRFVDTDNSIRRGLLMADQIIADQMAACEKPGVKADAPDPDSRDYRAPSEVVSVTVGPYTIHMMRGSRPALSEARPDGAEWPMVDIPEEWAEPIVALTMEVLRLREGWTVS